MKNQFMTWINRICWCALILALAAYVVKNIFVGADWDEGYAIAMGYRLAMGDKLFLEMWEPHQTSAIFTAFWIKLFLLLTNDVEFLNIYLRVIYFLIHGAISYFVYKTLHKCIFPSQKLIALWVSTVFFVMCPKSIFIPEYSNLHIWFFTVLCMSILWYQCDDTCQKNKINFLLLAGLALTCDVLAYPSMLILYFPLLAYIGFRSKKISHCLVFTIPGLLSLVIFGGYVFSYMTPDQFTEVLPYILNDPSHQVAVGIWNKLSYRVSDLKPIAKILLLTSVAAAVLTPIYTLLKNRKIFSAAIFLFINFILQVGYQFYCWFTSGHGAFYPHFTHCFLLLSGIYCYYRNGRKEKSCFFLMWISIINYWGVMLLSNWGAEFLTPYLITGALGGLVCLGHYLDTRGISLKGKIIPILCAMLIFNNVFGYCWLFIGGETNHSNLFTVSGLFQEGLRKRIYTTYMSAYTYNSKQEIWSEAVPAGSNCIYLGVDQFCYLMGDCRISAASTISTPIYDESLLKYWEINPDRYPDIVVLESGFEARLGDFMREWLENEFPASEIIEYPFFTVYRK